MARNALGLIETVGLVGAIEAADAAAKAAAVRLIKAEVTVAALVTIHIDGELGAVEAAVEAGVNACRKVGQLLSYVIIPRPDPGLDVMLETRSNLYVPKGPSQASALGPKDLDKQGPVGSPRRKPSRPLPRPPRMGAATISRNYETMTVQALRRLARRRGDLPIGGRAIARADKETLIRLLQAANAKG